MGMIRGPPRTPRSLCQHRQYASRCAERRFMRTDLWEPRSIPTGSSCSRCSLTRIELTRVFIKWYHEWGKKKRRKESKPMCYNFENGIFRYGVFFGLWKSVRFWNIWGLDGSMSRGKEIKESSNVFGIVMISFFFYLLGGKDEMWVIIYLRNYI